MDKQAFFFWGNQPLPFFNLLTMATFKHYHRDWNITLFRSYDDVKLPTWGSSEQRFKYLGNDYIEQAKALANQTYFVDYSKLGFRNNMHAVHKADILRQFLLFKNHGLWIDMDVFWFKSIEELKLNEFDVSLVLHPRKNGLNGHSTGVMYSSGNKFFEDIFSYLHKCYDPTQYQSVGPLAMNELFPSLEVIVDKYPELKFTNLPYHIFYPYHYSEINKFYSSNDGEDLVHPDTVCNHWFGGASASEPIINNLDYKKYECINNSVFHEYLINFMTSSNWSPNQ